MRVRCRGCRWRVQVPLAGSYSSALARIAADVTSSCDEHLAVGQQRRRVSISGRCRGCRWRSRSRSPDRTVPRSRECRCRQLRLRRAPCRWAATSPCETARAVPRLPVAVQVPLAGSYSSALARSRWRLLQVPLRRAPCRWAATSPCATARAVPRLPVAVQVPLAGSYSSALARLLSMLVPPATSTLPLGSNVAV